MIAAVIDLGTNTFNLLIAKINSNKSFQIIDEEKIPVLLGKKGNDKRYITMDAINRALEAMSKYHDIIKQYKTEHIRAFATSAIRNSLNGIELAESIEKKYNIHINIIDGDKEAELIYKGIRLTGCLDDKNALIMDIGGGSTEFIIGNCKQIFWRHSFELGASILLTRLQPSDPITSEEIILSEKFLDDELSDLSNSIQNFPCQTLIGASGAFDSFYSMISKMNNDPVNTNKYHLIQSETFSELHQKLLVSTLAEREKMPGLPSFRANYIVLASVFVNFVKNKTGINKIIHSAYALKEGVLSEIIDN